MMSDTIEEQVDELNNGNNPILIEMSELLVQPPEEIDEFYKQVMRWVTSTLNNTNNDDNDNNNNLEELEVNTIALRSCISKLQEQSKEQMKQMCRLLTSLRNTDDDDDDDDLFVNTAKGRLYVHVLQQQQVLDQNCLNTVISFLDSMYYYVYSNRSSDEQLLMMKVAQAVKDRVLIVTHHTAEYHLLQQSSLHMFNKILFHEEQISKQQQQQFNNKDCHHQHHHVVQEFLQYFLECMAKECSNNNDFVDFNNKSSQLLYSLLIAGEAGCGKTHLCSKLRHKVRQMLNKDETFNLKLISPSIPTDFCIDGRKGATEDMIFSLFRYISKLQSSGISCIVILDSLDLLIGDLHQNYNQRHIYKEDQALLHQKRYRSLFYTLLDRLTRQCDQQNNIVGGGGYVVMVSTSQKVPSRNGFRKCMYFESCFEMNIRPKHEKRREVLCSYFGIGYPGGGGNDDGADDVPSLSKDLEGEFNELVNNTIGMSMSELIHLCRSVKMQGKHVYDSVTYVQIASDQLRSISSSSSSTNDKSLTGIAADVTVFNSKQLLSTYSKDNNNYIRPKLNLLGDDCRQAWEKLESIIIPPLCRGKELSDLLNHRKNNESDNSVGSKYENAHGGNDDELEMFHTGICTGALIVGPPGTGKSELAHFCAAVASSYIPSIKLIVVPCTGLIQKEVGASEQAIKRLFNAARNDASPCILVLENIEAIAQSREAEDNTTEGTFRRLLSTLLVEIDGITSTKNGRVAVIGITQHEHWIDPALVRPGRLNSCIEMKLPSYETRRAIVEQRILRLPFVEIEREEAAANKSTLGNDDIVEMIAKSTAGKTGADVIGLCERAAFACAKRLSHLIETTEEDSLSESRTNIVFTRKWYNEELELLVNNYR